MTGVQFAAAFACAAAAFVLSGIVWSWWFQDRRERD